MSRSNNDDNDESDLFVRKERDRKRNKKGFENNKEKNILLTDAFELKSPSPSSFFSSSSSSSSSSEDEYDNNNSDDNDWEAVVIKPARKKPRSKKQSTLGVVKSKTKVPSLVHHSLVPVYEPKPLDWKHITSDFFEWTDTPSGQAKLLSIISMCASGSPIEPVESNKDDSIKNVKLKLIECQSSVLSKNTVKQDKKISDQLYTFISTLILKFEQSKQGTLYEFLTYIETTVYEITTISHRYLRHYASVVSFAAIATCAKLLCECDVETTMHLKHSKNGSTTVGSSDIRTITENLNEKKKFLQKFVKNGMKKVLLSRSKDVSDTIRVMVSKTLLNLVKRFNQNNEISNFNLFSNLLEKNLKFSLRDRCEEVRRTSFEVLSLLPKIEDFEEIMEIAINRIGDVDEKVACLALQILIKHNNNNNNDRNNSHLITNKTSVLVAHLWTSPHEKLRTAIGEYIIGNLNLCEKSNVVDNERKNVENDIYCISQFLDENLPLSRNDQYGRNQIFLRIFVQAVQGSVKCLQDVPSMLDMIMNTEVNNGELLPPNIEFTLLCLISECFDIISEKVVKLNAALQILNQAKNYLTLYKCNLKNLRIFMTILAQACAMKDVVETQLDLKSVEDALRQVHNDYTDYCIIATCYKCFKLLKTRSLKSYFLNNHSVNQKDMFRLLSYLHFEIDNNSNSNNNHNQNIGRDKNLMKTLSSSIIQALEEYGSLHNVMKREIIIITYICGYTLYEIMVANLSADIIEIARILKSVLLNTKILTSLIVNNEDEDPSSSSFYDTNNSARLSITFCVLKIILYEKVWKKQVEIVQSFNVPDCSELLICVNEFVQSTAGWLQGSLTSIAQLYVNIIIADQDVTIEIPPLIQNVSDLYVLLVSENSREHVTTDFSKKSVILPNSSKCLLHSLNSQTHGALSLLKLIRESDLIQESAIGVVFMAHVDSPAKYLSKEIREWLLGLKNTNPKIFFKIFKDTCHGYMNSQCEDYKERTLVFVNSISRLMGVKVSESLREELFLFFKNIILESLDEEITLNPHCDHYTENRYGKNEILQTLVPLARKHHLTVSDVRDIDRLVAVKIAGAQRKHKKIKGDHSAMSDIESLIRNMQRHNERMRSDLFLSRDTP